MKENEKRKKFFSSPARVIVSSFFLVILLGTILLILPVSTKSGMSTPPLEALFTATSATCVTGLVVYDTFTHWSVFGQAVILLLIQIGGLGLLSFTTFFNILIGKRLGLRGAHLAQESVNSLSGINIRSLIKLVVYFSAVIEVIGALLLSVTFVPKYGADGIFLSVFMSISSFCNAGFDILGREGAFSSLINYNDDPLVLLTIAGLIIVGGLGFVVWHDLLEYRKTKHLILHTKIVLLMTGILIAFGFVMIMALEWNNPKTLGSLPIGQRFLASFFQSITARTAGFNSIDMASMNEGTKLLMIFLMFIGVAPGSTGGGLKVTTILVLITAVVTVIRGREEVVLFKRKVSPLLVYKSLAIIVLGTLAVVLVSVMILVTHDEGVTFKGIDVVFEAVSAFSTAGLSVGVTAVSNVISKLMLAFTMFLGRVGPVSLLLSLAMSGTQRDKKIIPEAKIMVG